MKSVMEHEPILELLSTSDQARTVINEVSRITADVTVSTGLYNYNGVSQKVQWHDAILFALYPEGVPDFFDPEVVNIAELAWDNDDGSRTAYMAGLTPDRDLRLTKITYPPVNRVKGIIIRKIGIPEPQEPRVRSVSAPEADELIARISPIEPASADGWRTRISSVLDRVVDVADDLGKHV